MNDDDWGTPFRTRAEIRESLGDPKEVTAEVVAWVNAKARELRATTGVNGLIEAAGEACQRFPKCGRAWILLYLTFVTGEETTLSPSSEPSDST